MRSRAYCILLLAILASCREPAPQAQFIDAGLTSCVPAGAVAIAGIDLVHLRTSPLYAKIPAAFVPADASYLLLVSDAKDVLIISRGQFDQAPPGSTLIGHNLAISGPDAYVRLAIAQHAKATSGSPGLTGYAEGIAGGKQVWIVVRGGVRFPLTGNAANVNRLLRNTQYASLTARIDFTITLDAGARGLTADAAREFEETLRGFISLAAEAEVRQPDLAALLRSIRIERQDRTVRATLSGPPIQRRNYSTNSRDSKTRCITL